MDPSASQNHVESLRRGRVRPEPDRSMKFLKDLFKREVEKPYKQLGDLIEVWGELLPDELVQHSRLESLSRGVLNVVVDSSTRLYELDRLLREGGEKALIKRHRGPAFRRIKLRVGVIE